MKAWQLECAECKLNYGMVVLADAVTEKGEDDLIDHLLIGMTGATCGACGNEGEWGFELMVPSTITRLNIRW